jgi:hypothetical protein
MARLSWRFLASGFVVLVLVVLLGAFARPHLLDQQQAEQVAEQHPGRRHRRGRPKRVLGRCGCIGSFNGFTPLASWS